MSDDRIYPSGVVPAAVAILSLVVVVGMKIGALLARGCDRPEPIQMIATPMPAASSAATASNSAAASAAGRFRAVIPIGAQKTTLDVAPQARRTGAPGQSILTSGQSSEPSQSFGMAAFVEVSNGTDPGSIVIEFEQVLSSAATSSAQSSASSEPTPPMREQQPRIGEQHGRLGIIAATMPGILAADLQLLRLDVSPVTRWLVDVPLEVGVDAVGNLEAGGVRVSAGGKAFVLVGGWSRWNQGAQG